MATILRCGLDSLLNAVRAELGRHYGFAEPDSEIADRRHDDWELAIDGDGRLIRGAGAAPSEPDPGCRRSGGYGRDEPRGA